MIDFSHLRKYIYFPLKEEREKNPFVIHVLEIWGKTWIANRDIQELLAGQKKFYAVDRTQPYSDELWEACQDWVSRRDALDEEYKEMMEKGIGKQ